MASFAERVVLITGAGGGLGSHLAQCLAEQGASIAALDLRPEPLQDLVDRLKGKRVAWAVGDVTDRDSLFAAVRALENELGPIDLAIANAGIGRETSALQFEAAEVEAQVRVNLIGVANTVGAVLPGMLARGSGHLAAISSLASYRGLPLMAGYCASKAGVNGLMEGLRIELAPQGIAVTTICPGWIRTPLTQDIAVPHLFLMEPDEAARRIVGALQRRVPFLAFPSPSLRRMRLLRWLPAAWSDALIRRMIARFAKKSSPG